MTIEAIARARTGPESVSFEEIKPDAVEFDGVILRNSSSSSGELCREF